MEARGDGAEDPVGLALAVPKPIGTVYVEQMREHLAALGRALDEGRLEGFFIISRERATPLDPALFCFRRAAIGDHDASWGLVSALMQTHMEWMPRG